MPLSILQAAKYRPKAWLRAAETGSSPLTLTLPLRCCSLTAISCNGMPWHLLLRTLWHSRALSFRLNLPLRRSIPHAGITLPTPLSTRCLAKEAIAESLCHGLCRISSIPLPALGRCCTEPWRHCENLGRPGCEVEAATTTMAAFMLNSLLLGSLSSSGREATAPHMPAPASKHNLIADQT